MIEFIARQIRTSDKVEVPTVVHSADDNRLKPTSTDFRRRIYGRYITANPASRADVTDFHGCQHSLRKVIREHFPEKRDAAILDLGCGRGTLIYFARQAGYTVRGVDISPEQVAAARQLGLNSVEQGDLFEALAASRGESLDMIVTIDVIEHFRKDELAAFVDEVFRVLRKEGKWVINVPNGESPFVGRILYADLTHELAFTRQSIAQLVLSSGFRKVECFENAPIVHGVKSAVRAILWKILAGAMRLWITIESGDSTGAILSQNFLVVVRK